MKFRLVLAALCVAVVGGLSACGGGGAFSSVGGPVPKPPAGSEQEAAPSIKLSLQTADGANTTSVALGGVSARALVLDTLGQPVSERLVAFSTDAALAILTPASGQVLTDAQGIAIVQIAPASLQASGAGALTAVSSVDQKSVTASLDFQVTANNLQLKSLDLGNGPLPAYGNRPVSVMVTANGQPVREAVPVNFTTNCGVLSPTVANTDAKGVASTTFSATLPNCFGSTVSVSASIAGVAPVVGNVAIQAAAATNIQFVSSSPSTIYLSSATGPTQALITFKVVDNTGAAVANRRITLALSNAQAGVSIDTLRNTAPVEKTSDAQGLVSVSVFGGALPTSVVVFASAADIPPVSSNVLTVASGRAVQRSAGLSLGAFVIEGYNIEGTETSVTMAVTDRQGNPVADGTAINFVAEGGTLVPATCIIANGNSSCSTKIRSGISKDLLFGRVSILAYLEGEEDFIDTNSNNLYDPGEPFTDLGAAYNDWDENNVFTPNEFSLPRANGVCSALIPGATGEDNALAGDHGRPGTCDGKWGVSDIRRSTVVTFATPGAEINNWISSSILTLPPVNPIVSVRDELGNSMPFGTTISVSSDTNGCTATSSTTRVENIAFPLSAVQASSLDVDVVRAETIVPIKLKGCQSGAEVTVQVRSPGGTLTERTFTLQ